MPSPSSKKPFVSAKCCKCGSQMSHIRTPMALVCIRKKGLGVAAQLHAGGPGIVVYPRRCPQCGYVELFSPNRVPAELLRSRKPFRRSAEPVARN